MDVLVRFVFAAIEALFRRRPDPAAEQHKIFHMMMQVDLAQARFDQSFDSLNQALDGLMSDLDKYHGGYPT